MTEVVPDAHELATGLTVSLGMVYRRLRQMKAEGDLTLPESAALARLDRLGPMTPGELAKVEQISPQSMGATLGGLEGRGLVERSPDPDDGRRAVMSLTDAGHATLRYRRNQNSERVARALAAELDPDEMVALAAAVPLLERLAQVV